MADTVTRAEFNELRSDVTDIKNTLNNHVLSTLADHGRTLADHTESLNRIDTRLEGLESEVRHVKDGVQTIRDHFGI